MPLMPKRVKYRKSQRGNRKGFAQSGNTLEFGEYGLQALERVWLTAIQIEDNSVGYKYGENNLALQLDWKGEAAGFALGAGLEFRLSGSNSPANPWGDWNSYPDGGTRWLDEDLLEKRILAGFEASREFGPWRVYAKLRAGAAFDALSLRASRCYDDADIEGAGNETPVEKLIYLFSPTEGLTVPIFSATLGGSYRLELR